MKQAEIIRYLRDSIKHNAFRATICEELKLLDINASMMEYHENTYNGEAFGQMDVLHFMTGKACDDVYQAGEDEARAKIAEAAGDVIRLLDLGGWDGKAYAKLILNR